MSISRFGLEAMLVFMMILATGQSLPAGEPPAGNEALAKQLIERHETLIRPMEIEVGRSWWTANITGKDEDYKKKQDAETRLNIALSDPKPFAQLKAVKEGGVQDALLRREIQVLYLQYLDKQVDPELLKQMIAKSNAIEQAFNLYRPNVGGKELTDNEVRDILRHSADSAQRRAVWEANKGVGPKVESDLKQLVKLRNQAAKKLGFKDYHAMQLELNEQTQEQVLKLFEELDALTREPFHAAKAEIDAALAKNCGIPVNELRPWHYHDPFFQESPEVFGENADSVYSKLDVLKLSRDYYAGIGLPVDDVLARSDLFEKKGKNPHAFSTDIDREGDVRVLANIVPNRQWMETMLHELGHSVYSSKNIPRGMPYLLRCESHILTTEGVAMMFEKFADSEVWLEAMGVKVPDPKQFAATAAKLQRNRLLIFSRWCQVMFRFEKELYADPDQDLNRLWWSLVEKYQEIKPPAGRNAPDYAAKIHIVIAPAYYHNYMMGELFASQLHHAIAREVLHGIDPAAAVYVGSKEVGEFMKKKVIEPGRTLDWNQLTRNATGEDLNPKAFAADLGRATK
jgi:peptidyl-dipeptidase A